MRTMTPEQMVQYTNELADNLEALESKEVAVGITADSATASVYGTGLNVLQVGSIHEFGVGNNPQRSFIRNSNTVKASEIKDAIDKGLENISNGSPVETQLSFLGIEVQNIYKEAFTTRGFGTWPDISEATKQNKGSSQVLIDTGTLRRSINHEVRGR